MQVLLAVKGSKGRFITSQWLRRNGVFTWEASEWNELTQILQQVFEGNTIDESGIQGCATSLKLNRVKAVPKQIREQEMNTSSTVIVVDTNLLDQSTNIWNEQLTFLDRYRQKAKFAWILSRDTSNAIKVDLRRRGHFLMVSKPLYKTKMIQILDTVIKEESLENQRCGTSNSSDMSEYLHECHEIDPIHFEDVSSDDSSDMGNSKSISTVGLGGRTKEVVSAAHHSCYRASHSKKESTDEDSFPNILENPHLLLAEETAQKLSKDCIDAVNCRINSTDQSSCCKHNGIQQDIIGRKAEKLHDFQAPLAIITSEKCSKVIIEINQLNPRDIDMEEQENRNYPNSPLFNEEYAERQVEEKHISSSGNRQAEHVEKGSNSESLMKVGYRNNKLDYCHSTVREGTEASSKMAINQGALDGLYILLAEDNPILQRVATAMLEKVGATVLTVGDGMQAVDALKCMFCAEECRSQTLFQQEGKSRATKTLQQCPPFNLILMDCQVTIGTSSYCNSEIFFCIASSSYNVSYR